MYGSVWYCVGLHCMCVCMLWYCSCCTVWYGTGLVCIVLCCLVWCVLDCMILDGVVLSCSELC